MRHEAWFASVDWASEAHHVCVVGSDGSKRAERIFRHGGAGLAEMADWIAARCGGAAPEDIPVAIKIPHGPVVESLMDHGFAVYSINPKQLDRFRDRYSPADAKDDSLDARVLADALRKARMSSSVRIRSVQSVTIWPTATKTTATGATRWTTIASRSASMDPPTRVPAKRTSKTRTGAAASGSRAAICERAAEADVEEAKGKGKGEGKAKKTKTKTRAKGSGAKARTAELL